MAKRTAGRRKKRALPTTVDQLPPNAERTATSTPHPHKNKVSKPGPPMQDLQDFICAQNPYTIGSNEDMTLDPNYDGKSIVWDGWASSPPQFIYWFFEGQGGPQHLLRVSKAIRIPYTYTYDDCGTPKTKTEYLLIGFEGAGGY